MPIAGHSGEEVSVAEFQIKGCSPVVTEGLAEPKEVWATAKSDHGEEAIIADGILRLP